MNSLESLHVSPIHIVHILSKLDPVSGMRYLIHVRSHKYGFGKKEWFRSGLSYMVSVYPDIVSQNLQCIVNFGCWSDLHYLMGTSIENSVIELYAKQLTTDLHSLLREQYKSISLAAKWVPREKSQFNKRTNFLSKLCSKLCISKENLRKTYITPLRATLNITETLMCSGRWTEIDYSRVPRECLRRNSKIFLKHDPQRFSEYILSVYTDKEEYVYKPFNVNSLLFIPRRLPSTLEHKHTNTTKLYILGDTSGSCKLNSTVNVIHKVLASGTVHKWISWNDCTKLYDVNNIDITQFLESQESSIDTDLSLAIETILQESGDLLLCIMTDTDIDSTFCHYKEFLVNTELQSRIKSENRLKILHWNCNHKYVEICPSVNSYFRCIRGKDDYLVKSVCSKDTSIATRYIREVSLALSYLRINSRRKMSIDISQIIPSLAPQTTP